MKKFGASGGNKVPKAATKPLGVKSYSAPHLRQPRAPGMVQKSKDYSKPALKAGKQTDPLSYANVSFGQTGLTGES